MSVAHFVDISANPVGVVVRKLCRYFVSFERAYICAAKCGIQQKCLFRKRRFIPVAREYRYGSHKVGIFAVYACNLKHIRCDYCRLVNDERCQSVKLFWDGKVFDYSALTFYTANKVDVVHPDEQLNERHKHTDKPAAGAYRNTHDICVPAGEYL